MVLEALQAVWKRSIGADQLTRRQLKRMFDAADGSGNNGRNGAFKTERSHSRGWQGSVHGYTAHHEIADDRIARCVWLRSKAYKGGADTSDAQGRRPARCTARVTQPCRVIDG